MKVTRFTTALRRLQDWGWPGGIGALSLLAALALWAVVLPRLQGQLDAADQAVRDLRDRAWQARRSAQTPNVAVPAAAPWQAFIDGFAPAGDGRDRVAALWALAQVHGLAPVRSEFAIEPVDELPLQRLRLALPVSGQYPALRRFIAEALAADPALSLDGLRMERTGPQEPVVQAQMQWSFWMRRP